MSSTNPSSSTNTAALRDALASPEAAEAYASRNGINGNLNYVWESEQLPQISLGQLGIADPAKPFAEYCKTAVELGLKRGVDKLLIVLDRPGWEPWKLNGLTDPQWRQMATEGRGQRIFLLDGSKYNAGI